MVTLVTSEEQSFNFIILYQTQLRHNSDTTTDGFDDSTREDKPVAVRDDGGDLRDGAKEERAIHQGGAPVKSPKRVLGDPVPQGRQPRHVWRAVVISRRPSRSG